MYKYVYTIVHCEKNILIHVLVHYIHWINSMFSVSTTNIILLNISFIPFQYENNGMDNFIC